MASCQDQRDRGGANRTRDCLKSILIARVNPYRIASVPTASATRYEMSRRVSKGGNSGPSGSFNAGENSLSTRAAAENIASVTRCEPEAIIQPHAGKYEHVVALTDSNQSPTIITWRKWTAGGNQSASIGPFKDIRTMTSTFSETALSRNAGISFRFGYAMYSPRGLQET